MNQRLARRLSALALMIALMISSSAFAGKTVAREDLPAAVEKTLAREMVGATLKGISSEACEGKTKGTCFEVETTRGKESRDFVVDSAGGLVEVEEGVALGAVPEAVKASAAKLGKALKAEKVTRDGVVSYELVLEKAGKRSEHSFLPDGLEKK